MSPNPEVMRAALADAVRAICYPPCQYPKCVEADIAQACRGKARNVQFAIFAFLSAMARGTGDEPYAELARIAGATPMVPLDSEGCKSP